MRTYIFISILMLISLLGGCTTGSGTVINAIESNTSTKISMSYDKFNGYRERKIEVTESEPIMVTVDIVTKSGSIDAYIAKDNDTDNSSYEGHDIPTTKFTVMLSEQGSYTIRVDAKNHAGSYSFSWGEWLCSGSAYIRNSPIQDQLSNIPVEPRKSFYPEQIATLPLSARRYLKHAITPGTPAASTVRIKMHGTIKPKRTCIPVWDEVIQRVVDILIDLLVG